MNHTKTMSTPSGHFQDFPPSEPVITPKERIAHAVQIAAGLLASGHYTREVGDDYSPDLRWPKEGPPFAVTDALRIVDATVREVAK